MDKHKKQYLLQCMLPKSNVQRLDSSYQAIPENYPKAIDQLKERFGRGDLLVQLYVGELLSLLKVELPLLFDELENKF